MSVQKIKFILLNVFILLGSLSFLIVSYSLTPEVKEVPVEVENQSDQFIVVESKWERAYNRDCRYVLKVYGYMPLHRETDGVRFMTVVGDCDWYEPEDKLLIVEK